MLNIKEYQTLKASISKPYFVFYPNQDDEDEDTGEWKNMITIEEIEINNKTLHRFRILLDGTSIGTIWENVNENKVDIFTHKSGIIKLRKL